MEMYFSQFWSLRSPRQGSNPFVTGKGPPHGWRLMPSHHVSHGRVERNVSPEPIWLGHITTVEELAVLALNATELQA